MWIALILLFLPQISPQAVESVDVNLINATIPYATTGEIADATLTNGTISYDAIDELEENSSANDKNPNDIAGEPADATLTNGSISYDAIDEPEENSSASDKNPNDIAEVAYVPKCCPLGETRDPDHRCVKTNLTFKPEITPLEGHSAPINIHLLVGEQCKYGSYRLEPHRDSLDEFYLRPDGVLYVPNQPEQFILPLDYCLDTFLLDDGVAVVLPLVCFPPAAPSDYWRDVAFILYPIGCLISVPFLIMTIVFYCMIGEVRNLQGKVICCYSFCLAIAFLCLAAVQIYGDKMDNILCKTVAFMLQFFFISCFFWLNVMCFHTWRKTKRDILKKKAHINEKLQFTLYSLYGWGFPLLITCITLAMDFIPTIPPSFIKPNFGIEACWFNNDNATFSYFYGPITVLLVVNVIFFLLTIKYLHFNAPKQHIIHLRDAAKQLMIQRKRQIFIQCLLLFCMMGLNWILEVLSWKYGKPPELWIVIDTFNTLQGVVVFMVFVVRDDNVRNLVSHWWTIHYVNKDSHEESSAPLRPTV